jgi:4-hydroxybenzoate polyprenyltransferase
VNDKPLCVALDGALRKSTPLAEGLARLIRNDILNIFRIVFWLARGRAKLAAKVATHSNLDDSALPVNEVFWGWLNEQKSLGRRLVLCTATDLPAAQKIAAHLGIFAEINAASSANDTENTPVAQRLVKQYGPQGFDYAGHHFRDLAVWKMARRAIAVEPGWQLRRQLAKLPNVERIFAQASTPARSWLRALRLHQWSKNLLIFLPPAAAHTLLQPQVAIASLTAFITFGLCASGTYLLNDLMDLESDRRHPTKRYRPFAAADISVIGGFFVAPALLGAGLLLAFKLLGWLFLATMTVYVITTLWYSLSLKRIPMVDVLTLAGLYALRVIAGSAATMLVPSFWLLAFTMFLFLSLAVAKRFSELKLMMASGRKDTPGRGYTVDDAPLLQSCGLSAGYISVLVLALYVNSDMAQKNYSHVQILWVLCPLLLYWITRVWIKTSRGQMHDDPVVFTMRDRPSIIVACIGFLLVLAAT